MAAILILVRGPIILPWTVRGDRFSGGTVHGMTGPSQSGTLSYNSKGQNLMHLEPSAHMSVSLGQIKAHILHVRSVPSCV